MIKLALLLIASSGMSIPTAGMQMVDFLFHKMPDDNSVSGAFVADVDFWVGPDGKIRECSISRSVGNQERARLVCPAFAGYKIGVPKDSAGVASYGYTSTIVSAFPDGDFSLRDKMTVQLKRLPKASRDERLFKTETAEWTSTWLLAAEIGEDGRITHCDRASGTVDKDLAVQECSTLANRVFTLRTDDSGKPVRYVVQFKPEAN